MPSIDVTHQQEHDWVVRQGATRGRQFIPRIVVIQVTPVKVFRQGQVRLPRIRSETTKRFNRSFGQLQTLSGVINRSHVELIMRVCELVICKSKRWIALKCLFEQTNRFEKFVTGSENCTLYELTSADIKIVGGEIARGFLFDGRFFLG